VEHYISNVEGEERDLILQWFGEKMCSDGSHVDVIWISCVGYGDFFSRFFCRCVDLWAGVVGMSSEFALLVWGENVCRSARVAEWAK
jgi:hypothetical protein